MKKVLSGFTLINLLFIAITSNAAVTVTEGNLMWQQADDGKSRTWSDAKNYCKSLSLGRLTDWRMPTKEELKSLVFCSNEKPTPLPDYTYSISDEENLKRGTCGGGWGSYRIPTIDPMFTCSKNEFGSYNPTWTSTLTSEGNCKNNNCGKFIYWDSGLTSYTQIDSRLAVRCVHAKVELPKQNLPPQAISLLLNTAGWSDSTHYRHAETTIQRAIVAAALNGGDNRPSPQSIASGTNVVWYPDTYGGDGERMRLAIQDVYDYWIANSTPPLPLQSLPTDVQNSIRARLSATYQLLAQQNAFVEQIRGGFNGTVPTDDNQTLSYLSIRAQCKEFADRMVQTGNGTTQTYGSTVVERTKIRPGMYAFLNNNQHSAIIVSVYWSANGQPTKLRLAEANLGPEDTGWANPLGQVPWLRTVTTTREVPISDYYAVATE